MSAVAFVALGSNVGDRAAHLGRAAAALATLPDTRLLRLSRWYVTAPVGGPPGQGPFLNGAAALETELSADALLARLHALEERAGRVRDVHHGPRTLDLDLLLHGDRRSAAPDLQLPHPGLEERTFVLRPLAEIAPELVLPRSGLRPAERLLELRPRSLLVLDDPAAASAWCAARRAAGRTLGFVPTMGALHAGHESLVRRAALENDDCVVSVFVNPLQFGEASDFEHYPRDLQADARLLEGAGCALLFGGTLRQFFGATCASDTSLRPGALLEPGPPALGLEGTQRPGHFEGVATIVARLFDLVEPTRAYFGAKDFQQTLVVRDLLRRRGGPDLVVCPTEREPSGLARSSRNERLTAAERARAAGIHRALLAAREAWRAGERAPAALAERVRATLADAGLEHEYAEVRDPEAWSSEAPAGPLARAIALTAVRIGDVRLIDNLRLDEESP